MSKIPPEIVKTITDCANLIDVIADFITPIKKRGASFTCKCPQCGAEGKDKGLIISPGKNIFKCFNCDLSGKTSIHYLTKAANKSYPEALKYLADKYNIIIPDEERPKGPQRKGNPTRETFRDKQLSLSGLTDADQKATVVIDDGKQKIVDVFESGTRDQYGRIVPGDDMIIHYFDLEGKPVTFEKPKSSKIENLFRIRWQNPDLNKDKLDRPMKYASPYGSGSHLYIPEIVRKAYKDKRAIKRLYIQEGEKKAEKASKHGLFSVGVMGIQNLGSKGHLPYELQLIIQDLMVEEVIFVLDSDWDKLSNNIKVGDRVDQRPFSFYYAIKNYRDYLKTFTNMGIYLEIYFAYIRDNEKNDKGIDDLLANTLQGKENDLYNDIDTAINEKDGAGKYIQLNKISTVSDLKLLEFWSLQSNHIFANKYKNILENIPEFVIGRNKWRFDDGKLVAAQPLEEDEQYWTIIPKESRSGDRYFLYKFKPTYAFNFLKRRGFGRINIGNKKFDFCKLDNKIVSIVEPYEIRDFVMEFTKENVKQDHFTEVLDMLYTGSRMYFGPDSLSNIDFVHPVFERSDKGYQYMYFNEKYWKITADSIEERPLSKIQNYLWKDQVINFDAKLLENEFISVERIDDQLKQKLKSFPVELEGKEGQFSVDMSKAMDCHFARFIFNTSEFFWEKCYNSKREPLPDKDDTRTIDEKLETNLHFVSKMTAIGYLLHEFRDKSCEKAVIGMDGKNSQVGDANGRSGKSLLGEAIGQIIPQTYISGKTRDLTEDKFLFEEISDKIRNVFIDDVRVNLDFEFFFPLITGRMAVNKKGIGKVTLDEKTTPKFYISTNHAINGNTGSFKDRQALIAFSDFYSDDHKPIHDFGVNFFSEWDATQRNLFLNFMASCLQLYFKAQKLGWGANNSGLINPPLERLEMRRLRQEAGETFFSWADEFFCISDDDDVNEVEIGTHSNLNMRLERRQMFNDFLDKNPTQKKFITSNAFYKKMLAYSKYRKLRVNPHIAELSNGRPGYDKSAGVEYITIANAKF